MFSCEFCEILRTSFLTEQLRYVAKIWTSSFQSNVDASNFSGYGWDLEGNTEWVHNPFPNDRDHIIFDRLFDEDDYESGSECEESDDIVRLIHKNILSGFRVILKFARY